MYWCQTVSQQFLDIKIKQNWRPLTLSVSQITIYTGKSKRLLRNSIDPDETAHSEPSCLNLRRLTNSL